MGKTNGFPLVRRSQAPFHRPDEQSEGKCRDRDRLPLPPATWHGCRRLDLVRSRARQATLHVHADIGDVVPAVLGVLFQASFDDLAQPCVDRRRESGPFRLGAHDSREHVGHVHAREHAVA